MLIKDFVLLEKKNLTYNVFEITFKSSEKLDFIHGQFITFILPSIGGRAYSILEVIDGIKITLIIKRVENGRGGSKFICDSEIGTILKGVGPAGHFTLRETDKNKLFLGTGTGFVPLYNQIIGSLELGLNCNLRLIFGLKYSDDIYYENILNDLKTSNSNFDYNYYLSRENDSIHPNCRVTDFLSPDNIIQFEEFYICGISAMIDSCIELLTSFGVSKEQIITEKY